jgi:type VII secretion-associated serine protease mycosin
LRLRLLAAVAALMGVVLGPASAAAAAEAAADQWQLEFLHAAEANAITEGDGVVIALIDSGVDGTHPDLAGSLISGFDFDRGSGNGQSDLDGHGTSMAGFIAAHGQRTGIAPKAKIMPLKAGLSTTVPKAFDWAVEHGATIISVSQSGKDSPDLEAAVNRALAAGVLVVAGAGNVPGDHTVTYPAAYPGVIAVGAIGRSGQHATVSVTGSELVLAAPGEDLATIIPMTFGGYAENSFGTSDATALVAGVAALVKAKFPDLKGPEIYHRLIATADDKGAPGRDPEYGYGIVNPVQALTADVAPATASATPATSISGGTGDAPPADSGGGLPLGFIVVGAAALLIIAMVVGLVMTTRRSR